MAKKRGQSAKKALFFPREPEGSVAHRVKTMERRELEWMMDPVLDLLTTDPRLHQLAALAIGVENNAWLFAMDMGTGKSKVAIDIRTCRAEMGEVNQTLVTCPPIVLRHWQREVSKHSTDTAALCTGTTAQKVGTLLESQEPYVVVSHHWLTRFLSDTAKGVYDDPEVFQALGRFDMLVVDEAHALGNWESVGFNAYADYLMQIPYCYLLTGTPVGNNYDRAWALYYLLDEGQTFGRTFDTFRNRWFYSFLVENRAGRKFPMWRMKKQRRDAFFDRFWTRAVRWEEAECQDLPEKVPIDLPLSLSKEQARIYDQMLDIPDEEITDDHFWNLVRVTGGVWEGLDQDTPCTKMEALFAIIEEVVLERQDPLIVWHHLNDEGAYIVKHIRKKFSKLGVGEARGKISASKKDKALEQWAAGDIQILVANPGSLGVGVDLYEANVAVFYSNGHSFIGRSQAMKRIHREGQTRTCYYIDLFCETTVDEEILASLQSSQDSFAGLTRDRAWRDLRRRRHQEGKLREELSGA